MRMYEMKRNNFKGPKFSIFYWRISVALWSGIVGLYCTMIRDHYGPEQPRSNSGPLSRPFARGEVNDKMAIFAVFFCSGP